MVYFHLALGSSSPKRAWDGSGAFSIRVSGRLIARFEASHVSVVRRHVRSKRRWHRDYLLAHLAPVVVRLSALVPPLGRQPRVPRPEPAEMSDEAAAALELAREADRMHPASFAGGNGLQVVPQPHDGVVWVAPARAADLAAFERFKTTAALLRRGLLPFKRRARGQRAPVARVSG
jgi:hypothetical protein